VIAGIIIGVQWRGVL